MPKQITAKNNSKKIGKKIIIGNWKMNPAFLKDAEKMFSSTAKAVSRVKKTEIVVCPPFLYLERLKKLSKKISLGAQDAFGEDVGPYTGEVSAKMLAAMGIKYVILGHSERRELGESNALVNQKIKGALAAGLLPILCVGEKVRDETHGYFGLVKVQLEECLAGIPKHLIPKIIIAYEPVWALSTTMNRKDATPADALEMVIFIRKVLADKFNINVTNVRIIYGGSANEKDALDFLEQGGVDGLLPGRASLDSKKFAEIINIAEKL